jgi:hypothetical protein
MIRILVMDESVPAPAASVIFLTDDVRSSVLGNSTGAAVEGT